MAVISSFLYVLLSMGFQSSIVRHPVEDQLSTSKNEIFQHDLLSPHCSPNEMLAECINPCNNCQQHGVCLDYVYSCLQGCDCIEGYLRDNTGKCIAEKECKDKESLPIINIESHGCSNNASICAIFCQTMYTKNGRCIGSEKKECQCY